MHIFMVRHGQSQSNATKTVTGSRECELTLMGQHQAELTGQKLKDANIGLIISSSLNRAKQTAKIIAKQINYPINEIVFDSNLAERGLGDLEGQSYEHNPRLNGNFPETELIKNVEPLEHLHSRVSHALKNAVTAAKTKNVLIVCHLGIGRMLWVITKNLKPIEIYNQPRLENAKIYKII